jgi:topoisomerase-4 subunit A
MADNTHVAIETVDFSDALSERYLAYALSTIMSRSLPDVRDGLKPVHRRLLYAMRELKLDPNSGFKKCARIVGDVMGKFHPHGDTAIYDTLVRLAQDFSVRYPLIDGQGNFGSIDGDNAAAMRYTESRLTKVALRLMADLDQDTVDFRPTYDGQEQEPILMPASFPNVLANGSEGIAVGMATSIPPHNMAELADALLALIDRPEITVAELCSHVLAPDFPTGGVIMESQESIIKAYETGRGSFRLRARWEKEELSHGLFQVIITEIPYQISKSRLIEKIADLYREKKLPFLSNIRDESSDLIRIVLEPKTRAVDAAMLMESLFKLTDLEVRMHLNMNVLTKASVPQVLSLKQVLEAFLDHRHEVILRRSRFRLGEINRRLEILAGLRIAYLNLDELIRILREEDEPKAAMIAAWQLTDTQAEAILNMRLRSLRRLEEHEIGREYDLLSTEQASLNALLTQPAMQWKKIREEMQDLRKEFDPKKSPLYQRRTSIVHERNETAAIISIEAFIEREPITVVCSQMGWIRSIKGHNQSSDDVKYKEGDGEKFFLQAYSTDRLLVFTSFGKCYTLACDKLPGGKSHGEPIRLHADIESNEEIVTVAIFQPEQQFAMISNAAKGFRILAKDAIASTRMGRQILVTEGGAALLFCKPVMGPHVAFIGENRKILIFSVDELPFMKRGQGVGLQKYKQGTISDMAFLDAEKGLSWKTGERTRTEADLSPWMSKRGGMGRMAPLGFPRDNKFPTMDSSPPGRG